ncbi:dihydroxyacetone kinase subunit DhaL [Stomatohabitans albus]|uniref:dihydroxyacetone kinase subunit DhaL n=1 Tax=Stomatohabitans albus TaxID=3110766 RepID=UPI003AB9A25C
MSANAAWAKAWMVECANVVGVHREELIDLDRAIGDADHGENLDRGFNAVVASLADKAFATPSEVFKTVSMTLMSNVGGAYGPLVGTAFLRASTVSKDAEELDASVLADVIAAAAEGIQARGRAELGEKTMLDAWLPAAEAAKAAADTGKSPIDTLKAAASAAQTGAEATDAMTARKGRASYLGSRSVGHRDPGAQSTAYILDAAARTLEKA